MGAVKNPLLIPGSAPGKPSGVTLLLDLSILIHITIRLQCQLPFGVFFIDPAPKTTLHGFPDSCKPYFLCRAKKKWVRHKHCFQTSTIRKGEVHFHRKAWVVHMEKRCVCKIRPIGRG